MQRRRYSYVLSVDELLFSVCEKSKCTNSVKWYLLTWVFAAGRTFCCGALVVLDVSLSWPLQVVLVSPVLQPLLKLHVFLFFASLV